MATLSVGGTTVFDGSALQSGVTGTIGTGVTFPTGHILQSVWAGDKSNISTASQDDQPITALECSLTARQTDGKFVCIFIAGRVDDNVATGHVAARLYKSENGGAYARVDNPAVSNNESVAFSGNYTGVCAFCYQYTATITAGQNIKFKPYFSSDNDTTLSYMNLNGFMSLTVQEIQL